MLEQALEYAAAKWLVFPCMPRGKEPLTKRGFKDATLSRTKIQNWWKKWPDANIGIATGFVSELVVVDFDPRNGGDVHAFMREHGDRLTSLRYGKVSTGSGGQHWYFRYDSARPIPSMKDLLPGVDVKGDGGYVIAAPSIHPCGAPYAWLA